MRFVLLGGLHEGHIPVILVLVRLRQEDCKSEVAPGYEADSRKCKELGM